jgi:hypothetical protein
VYAAVAALGSPDGSREGTAISEKVVPVTCSPIEQITRTPTSRWRQRMNDAVTWTVISSIAVATFGCLIYFFAILMPRFTSQSALDWFWGVLQFVITGGMVFYVRTSSNLGDSDSS